MQQSVLTTEYLYSTITAESDPTGDVVQWAFTDGRQWPTSDTPWIDAEWEPGSTGNVARTRLLVGPENSGHVVPLGFYSAWVRITDTPEVPVKFAGYLTIS
jgi:hypothetical protein